MKKSTKKILWAVGIAGVIVLAVNFYSKRRKLQEHAESTAIQLANQAGAAFNPIGMGAAP